MKKVLSLLLMGLILFSCTTQKNEEFTQEMNEEVVTDFELAQYISGHTSGTIKPDAPIIIRFSNNIVSNNMIGEEEDRIDISVSPYIAGKAIWDNRNVLKFLPHQDFSNGETYNFRINIEGLLEEDVSVKPLVFKVKILMQDIIEFNADLVRSKLNENELTYAGTINFLLPTTLDDVKQASVLKLNMDDIPINWNGSGTSYEFSSNTFERIEDSVPIYFRIDREQMEMDRNFVRESSLSSLHEMVVILVKRIHEQQSPGIEIQFSDDLNLQQEISGYIMIKPDIKFDSKKLGNRIILNGDFEFGKSYQLTVRKGIVNNSGLALLEDHLKEISFNDENPQMIFAQSGCFLPSGNEKKIQFSTMNLKSVNLTIKHVYENNLNFFLQVSNLNSTTSNSNSYYSFHRVGEEVINQTLELGEVRNEWLVQELDLSKLIPAGDKGLYLIELNFNQDNIYYRGVDTGNENYYTNPLRNGYYSRNGRITKPVILSDIGLTLKVCADRYLVYATDLMTTEPLAGCNIELKTYQNQVLASETTNGDGRAEFRIEDKTPFFVEASRNEQRTILKTSEMIWNTSNFDVEGVQYSTNGIRAYTYTERGVYRPGDPVNLSMIFRNHEDSFEAGHPVHIEVRNPRNQLIQNKVLNDGMDGFYNFNFITNPTDPTGEWKIKIMVGGSVFYHILKIETVVAERLKINLTPESESISAEMEKVNFDLQANFLFGAPAADLKCQISAEIYKNSSLFNVPRFRTFSFDDPAIDYKVIEVDLLDSTLDSQGKLKFDWEIPEFNNAPTGLVAKLETTVNESGGRSSKENIFLPIDPYFAYVGLQDSGRQWKKLKQSNLFKSILLDPEGIPLVGEDMIVRIYHNRYHWWWEYNNSQRHFKDDVETELLQVINLKSKSDPVEFEFTPLDYGRYYVEVTHLNGTEEGHTAGLFFWGSYWGNPNTGMQDAGIISLD